MATHSMRSCQKRLFLLWLLLAGGIFVLVVGQSVIGDQYGKDDQLEKVWGWLLPTIMPTLSLIVAVLAAGALLGKQNERPVDPFFYRTTMAFSTVYLLIVLAVIVARTDTTEALALMQKSNLFLGPFQGLVSASMGIFFVKGPAPGS